MSSNLGSRLVSKVVKGVLLVTIVVTCFSGCTKFAQKNHPANTKNPTSVSDNIDLHKLPSDNQTKQRLQELLGDNYQDYLLNENTITRLPCPKNGGSIKVNVEFNANPTQQEMAFWPNITKFLKL